MNRPKSPSPAPDQPLFDTLLVANRGEIALRVIRTARELGIRTVAVYSDVDRNALHVRRADHAVPLRGNAPGETYLDIPKILAAARQSGARAIHPGYGFLSENGAFAQAVADAGLVFVGPPAAAMAIMGNKVSARQAAQRAQVPVVPGLTEEGRDDSSLVQHARTIGYPVMLKAAAGGGGKGIRIVTQESDLVPAAALARAEAHKAFGNGAVYLEKLLEEPRHIEIQVMADSHGNVVTYGERECSVQRRHQKMVEESPSCALDPATRTAMEDCARKLAAAVGYRGAGTMEFLWSRGKFYFLEMNTRLQVEHPITEERFGVDLVAEQLRIAAGLPLEPVPQPRGHSIEVRVNAEDPDTFLPALGRVTRLTLPGGPGVRVDSALYRGLEVTPHYDSLLAKVVVHAATREAAIARMVRALSEVCIAGVATCVPAALRALRSPAFRAGVYDTSLLTRLVREPAEEVRLPVVVAAALDKHLGHARGGQTTSGGLPAPSPWVLAERRRSFR